MRYALWNYLHRANSNKQQARMMARHWLGNAWMKRNVGIDRPDIMSSSTNIDYRELRLRMRRGCTPTYMSRVSHCAFFLPRVFSSCRRYLGTRVEERSPLVVEGGTTSIGDGIKQTRELKEGIEAQQKHVNTLELFGQTYVRDEWTNIPTMVMDKLGRNLHNQKHHPLWLLKERIKDYFYREFTGRCHKPLFSVHDTISPVVTTQQNFDSLLVPPDHPSRYHGESYYLNAKHLLRAHTSAHQRELVSTGLDAFLLVGDVYRRDTVDRSHFPVFHQVEGLRLFSSEQLFASVTGSGPAGLDLFEAGTRTTSKQESHSLEAAHLVASNLQHTLKGLIHFLFGTSVETRWVPCTFPFTHPSFELEIKFNNTWLEVLGCGVTEQKILHAAGAGDRIGWAFGLGLERLAMVLFSIPDIRLFWSNDECFSEQFKVDDIHQSICFKPLSPYPPLINDLSFWIPSGESFDDRDFYELVRTIAGELVQEVKLIDKYTQPGSGRHSRCYRLVYRHAERTLTKGEVDLVHRAIGSAVETQLGGKGRF
uniref:phenylalanine--tRNA ligase, mitochondrial-like isoform X1 n=1 Tax=Myxine glutinosa TaxID=7769 RepID=UPI00358E21E8